MTEHQTARVRALNDRLRREGRGGRIQLSAEVAQLSPCELRTIIQAMVTFDAFESGDDPYAEHDFGALEFGQRRVFWKIDYYDATLMVGANDPADDTSCVRVLTIMFANEY